MLPDDPNEVIATAGASMGRRFVGLSALALLGFLVIYLAIAEEPGLFWRVFLIALGILCLWIADKMRRATASRIELTSTELRDEDGTVIARIEDIESLDRGAFAFKPSNGFLVKTRNGVGREWRPGLWWRIGPRIGIGGMTPGNETKFMSELISGMVALREMDAQGENEPKT